MRRRPLRLALLLVALPGLSHSAATAAAAESSPPADGVVKSGELRLPHVLPGEPIRLQKVLDADGRPRIATDSPWISGPEELEALRELERAEIRARYGNLGPELRRLFDAMGPLERVTVAVHPPLPHVVHLDKYAHDEAELEAHSRSLLAVGAADLGPVLAPYAKRSRLPVAGDTVGGPEVLEVDRATLALMRFDPAIGEITLHRPPQPTSWPIQEIVDSSYNPPPLPAGARGAGVKAATYELGIHPNNAACWNVGPPEVHLASPSTDPWTHSNSVFALLVNGAPDADFHHFYSTTFGSTGEQYMVANGVETLSISYQNFGDANGSTARRMDDLAYRWPFPVFTNPTANDGYEHEAHWQQYNGISVGNVRHTGNLYYELNGTTQTRNPDPIYGPTLPGTAAGDREMPHIVSPGFTPYPNDGGAIDPCAGWFPIWNGTSFSAPLANAVAANVISSDPRMVSKPELVKAVILATAKNVERGDWSSDEDGRDGAGAISAREAVWLAQNGTTVPENGQAQAGFGHGSLNDADQGRELVFNVQIPATVPAGRHLRAVLVWTSNPDQVSQVNSLSDLDLTLGNKTTGVLGGSYSLDDNVEIIDVPREAVTPGATYPLRVQVTDTRIPAGATASFFYYAVAWSWVKDFFFHEPVFGGHDLGVVPTYYCSDVHAGSLDEETAERFCREMGYTGFVDYDLHQASGVHTWWNGSSWSVSGNSLVCYLENLLCESTERDRLIAVDL